ncbi:MAG: helix-turn-helix transcriptional regulator [Proteobacteria bacterium]|nr:helix-turn-helix transcriptional regulator [Pseudomonadota bacterium]
MSNQNDFIARAKERLQSQREAEQRRLQTASEHGVKYDKKHRAENLRLLRAFFDVTQEKFISLLGVSSQSQYSKFERGEEELEARLARQIEKSIGLPEMWFDRDNANLLFLSLVELSLVNEIRVVDPEATRVLASALKLLTGRGA